MRSQLLTRSQEAADAIADRPRAASPGPVAACGCAPGAVRDLHGL